MRLGYVHQPTQPTPASSPRLTHVREGPFTSFAPPPVQSLSPFPAHSSPVRPERRLQLRRLLYPHPLLLLPFRNIRSHLPLRPLRQELIVVIPLVDKKLMRHLGNRSSRGRRGARESVRNFPSRAFLPRRWPISAKLIGSGSVSCNCPLIWFLRIWFSVTRYSLRRRSS